MQQVKQTLESKNVLLGNLYIDLKDGLLSQEEYFQHRKILLADITALKNHISELETLKNNNGDQLLGEMKWMSIINRYYDAEELSADMITYLIESIRINKDGSLDIKFNFMDEFERLAETCQQLGKGVA